MTTGRRQKLAAPARRGGPRNGLFRTARGLSPRHPDSDSGAPAAPGAEKGGVWMAWGRGASSADRPGVNGPVNGHVQCVE